MLYDEGIILVVSKERKSKIIASCYLEQTQRERDRGIDLIGLSKRNGSHWSIKIPSNAGKRQETPARNGTLRSRVSRASMVILVTTRTLSSHGRLSVVGADVTLSLHRFGKTCKQPR